MTRLIPLFALLLASPALGQGGQFDAATQRALDALKDEPTIQAAQKAALQFFNIDADTVSSMRTRAAVKALLPRLDARYRLKDTTVDGSRVDRSFDDNVALLLDDVAGDTTEFEVGGSWNLPQLVFNSEVLDVSSLAVLQEGVLKEVTRLYYTRRRLQVDLILNPPKDAASRLSKQLRIDELTATLDALTGNLFTRTAARAGRLESRRRAMQR